MKNPVNEAYLAQIQKYPLLTAEQEIALSKKIHEGSKTALESLVNSNLRLVVSLVHHFQNCCVPVMDLIQEGNLGLMVAAKKFSFSFDTRFSTYAYPWIIQYMNRYVCSHVPFISLPLRKKTMLKKIKKASEYLTQINGAAPTTSELASYLDISERTLKSLLNFEYKISSIDAENGDEGEAGSLADFLADFTYNPEVEFLSEEQKKEVRGLVDVLSSKEKRIINLRYNFAGGKMKTLREISKIAGVSPEAVRQTELRALRHLRMAAVAL